MIAVRALGEGLWLAVANPPAPASRRGRCWAADRHAARLAWDAALQVSGYRPSASAVSRAHTAGVGVALVGPSGTILGVDLVAPDRLTSRHLDAILNPDDRPPAADHRLRPALVWGLKEAAAKASGQPARYFPDRVTLVSDGAATVALLRDPAGMRLAAAWEETDGLLCARVVGRVPSTAR